jgi:hypothetical protein
MWRRPLAYGHATATRIFRGGLGALIGANDMESLSGSPAHAEPASGKKCEQRERAQQQDAST